MGHILKKNNSKTIQRQSDTYNIRQMHLRATEDNRIHIIDEIIIIELEYIKLYLCQQGQWLITFH